MQGDFTIGELKNVPTRGRHEAQIGVTVDPRGQVSPLPAPVRQYLGD
jgi:hypothetical protein